MEPTAGVTATTLSNNSNPLQQQSLAQKIQAVAIPLLGVLTIVLVFLVFRYSPVSDDAAYYLVVAREIAVGVKPYIDLEVVYTPFALYLNSIIFSLTKGFDYSNFIGLQLSIVAGCSFLIYLIYRKRFALSKATSFLAALLLFSSILSFEGYYIVTEPYIVFFILLSFYTIYQSQRPLAHIAAAILLSFAFFSKQYGLFAVVPFAFLSFVTSKNRLNAFYFILAYTMSIAGFFLIFSGGHVEMLFNQLFASPLQYKSKKLTNAPSLLKLLAAGKVFYLLLIPLLIRVVRNGAINAVLLFCFGGILIFLAPLLINQNQHHFIHTLPFLFLAYGASLTQKGLANFEKVIPFIVFFIFSFVIINRLRIHAYKKEEQVAVANEVRKQYKNGEAVFIMGKQRHLYLLNNYQNPLKQQLSYTWNYKVMEEAKELLNQKNVLFSFCFEKDLFIDSLKVKPASYMCIEDCSYQP